MVLRSPLSKFISYLSPSDIACKPNFLLLSRNSVRCVKYYFSQVSDPTLSFGMCCPRGKDWHVIRVSCRILGTREMQQGQQESAVQDGEPLVVQAVGGLPNPGCDK